MPAARKKAKKSKNQPEAPVASRHRLRMRLVFWGILMLFGLVGVRLVDLQATPDQALLDLEEDHESSRTLQIPRGDIVDREGRVLATDRMARSLAADPSRVSDPNDLSTELASKLSVDRSVVLERLAGKRDNGKPLRFVWIKRWLTREDLDNIDGMPELAQGVLRLQEEPLRFYPEGALAAHVLGFVNQERVGSAGLEMHFDRYLSATAGHYKARIDNMRRFLPSHLLDYRAPGGGADLHLTIDSTIQHKLEQELAAALERCKAERGSGIVMDPKTGAILALACYPTYDPNRFQDATGEERKFRAVINVFEPGSSFKIVTAAAALEHKLVTRDTLIDCEGGSYNPYGHRIGDYHKLGVEPFSVCFAESSNIAIIKVAAMLGPERLDEWIRRFGFGQKIGCDFGGAESRGIFRPHTEWSGLSMGSLPMGQEISVTLPQMARAFSAIANGGFLVEPHLVALAVSRDGMIVYQHEPSMSTRILSPETAATMRELCHEVVTHGTGTRASIDEYRVGGKTGTAQVAREDGRGYKKNKYNTVFAGFAPVADPKVCAVIVVNEPDIRLHYGGYVCGPVFREVVREALIRLNCPEDPVQVEVENLAETDEREGVMAELELDMMEPELEDITEELELAGLSADATHSGPRLPDFRGLTKRQAKVEVAALGLPWDIDGTGWVAIQDPPAGTPLSEVTLCKLHFSNKRKKDDEAEPTDSAS